MAFEFAPLRQPAKRGATIAPINFDRPKPAYTTQQMLQRQFAMAQEAKQSFWDRVGSGFKGLASGALNIISRPWWSITGGVEKATRGGGFDVSNFFTGAASGIKGETKLGFGQLLDKWGVLEDHDTLRGIAGFGLDVALDPLTYLTFGASAAAKPALVGAKALIRAGDTGLDDVTRKIANQFVVDTSPQMAQRRAFAELILQKDDIIKSGAIDNSLRTRLNILGAGALEETEKFIPRGVQASLRVPFTQAKLPLTPVSIAGKQVAPRARRFTEVMESAAEKNIPLTRGFGEKFLPGFGDTISHRMAMAAKHSMEYQSSWMGAGARSIMGKFLQNPKYITADGKVKARTFAEQNELIRLVPDEAAPQGIRRELREDVLKQATDSNQLTPHEVDWLRAHHTITEMVRKEDFSFGIEYPKVGVHTSEKMYFPHVYRKDGLPIDDDFIRANASILGEAGFSKDRLLNMPISAIAKLGEDRAVKRLIETDPDMALARRIRSSAQKQVDNVVIEEAIRVAGVPLRVFDRPAIAAAEKAVIQAEEGQRFAEGGAQLSSGVPLKTQQALRTEQGALERLQSLAKTAQAPAVLTNRERQKLTRAMKGSARKPVALQRQLADVKEQIGVHRFNPSVSKPLKRQAAKIEQQIEAFNKRLARQDARKLKEVEDEILAARKGKTQLTRAQLREAAKEKKEIVSGIRRESSRARAEQRSVHRAKKEDLAKQLGMAKKTLADLRKGKVNPKLSEVGHKNLPSRFKIDGIEYAVPQNLYEAVNRQKKFMTDDDVVSGVLGSYRKLLGKWKMGVTAINPGYRVRNTVSDMWNMWLAGVPLSRMVEMGIKAGIMMTHARTGALKEARGEAMSAIERKSTDILARAYGHGALSGLFQGDIELAAQGLKYFGSRKALRQQRKPFAYAGRLALDLNRTAENLGRLTHYLYRMEKQGMSSAEAAQWVRIAHFDYEDLTDVEQRVFKNIAPFYTWTRKNIPYQLKMLVQHPGRMAAFPKFAFEMEAAAGETEGDLIPDWMRDNMAIAFPGGAYFIPQIGAADLAKLEHPSLFKGLLSPAFKLPLEILTGTSMQTGQQITGGSHPRNAISDFGANLLNAVGLGGVADVGITARNVEGEYMQGMGANPWVGHIAAQLPWTNFAINQMSDIKSAQRGGRLFPILSQIGGLSVWKPDQEAEMVSANMDLEEQFDRWMRGKRDEGVIPNPEVRPPSDFEREMDRIVRDKYGRANS